MEFLYSQIIDNIFKKRKKEKKKKRKEKNQL